MIYDKLGIVASNKIETWIIYFFLFMFNLAINVIIGFVANRRVYEKAAFGGGIKG